MYVCPACDAPTGWSGHAVWTQDWRCPSCGAGVPVHDGIPCLAPTLIGSESGFDTALFDRLAGLEETNFWFVARAERIVALLRTHFPAARSVLEIGCGTGSLLLALEREVPGLSLTGSELHPEGLVHARRRLSPATTLMQMDARAIPAREEFDVIGAFDVIEHIADDLAVLRSMWSAVKRGGGIMLSVPQHMWLWSPFDTASRHERRYARTELQQKVESCGFRVVYTSSFNALLLPVMLVSRWRMRREAPGDDFDALSEMNVPNATNRALTATLRLENALAGGGIRWPVGGSRIVVAVKP